jgi:hypothetical protein
MTFDFGNIDWEALLAEEQLLRARAAGLQAMSRIAAGHSWSPTDQLRRAELFTQWIIDGKIKEERRW